MLGSNIITEDFIDNGAVTNQISVEDLSDAVNVDDFIYDTNNDQLFGPRHTQTRNVAIAYYFLNILDSPPLNQ